MVYTGVFVGLSLSIHGPRGDPRGAFALANHPGRGGKDPRAKHTPVVLPRRKPEVP